MSENTEQSEVEVKTGFGTARIRGYDFLTIFVCAGLVLMAYTLWRHSEETLQALLAVNAGIKEGNAATLQLVKEQRFATCIQATPEANREKEYSRPDSFCNRFAK